MRDDVSGLTQLGAKQTVYRTDTPNRATLETFPNPWPQHDYVVNHTTHEWGSLCPVTGQPDTGTIEIDMTPDRRCVESKSLKLYFFAYRNHGAFMENIVNTVLDDLVAVCEPRWCRVVGRFRQRGGIATTVTAAYKKTP